MLTIYSRLEKLVKGMLMYNFSGYQYGRPVAAIPRLPKLELLTDAVRNAFQRALSAHARNDVEGVYQAFGKLKGLVDVGRAQANVRFALGQLIQEDIEYVPLRHYLRSGGVNPARPKP